MYWYTRMCTHVKCTMNKKEKNILRGKLFVIIIMLPIHIFFLTHSFPYVDNVWINATKHEIQRLNTQKHVQCCMKNCLKHAIGIRIPNSFIFLKRENIPFFCVLKHERKTKNFSYHFILAINCKFQSLLSIFVILWYDTPLCV